MERELYEYSVKVIERELFNLSIKYDKLPKKSTKNLSFSFSQIQVEILTARLLRQLSSNDFVFCNEVLSRVANSSWSNKKKGYVILHMWGSFGFYLFRTGRFG